jgi:hypothetical protein
MSRPLEATSGRAPGITPVLLQRCQTASSTEIRAGNTDTGHAGRIDRKAADAAEIFCSGTVFLSGIVRGRARVRLPGNIY